MPPAVPVLHGLSGATLTAIWWLMIIGLEWLLAALTAVIGVQLATALSNRYALGSLRLQQHVQRYRGDAVVPMPDFKTRREFHSQRARELPLPVGLRGHAVLRLSDFQRRPPTKS